MRVPISFFAILLFSLEGCAGVGNNLPTSPQPSPRPQASQSPSLVSLLAGGTKGSRDGQGGGAAFDGPAGLDVDSAGHLFLVETGGHRVRKIEANGLTVTIAGSEKGWLDGPGSHARFNAPSGISLRRDGVLAIADTGNHIIRLISQDNEVTTVTGIGGSSIRSGELVQSGLKSPFGVAWTSLDELLVADTGNHQIKLIDVHGQIKTTIGSTAGYVDGPLTRARFNGPTDLAVDNVGRVYVCDLGNHAIRVIDISRDSVQTLAGDGHPGNSNGIGHDARFRFPVGLGIDNEQTLLVADAGNGSLRAISRAGVVSDVSLSESHQIADTVMTPDGTMYFSDEAENAIFKVVAKLP